ncbi:hypothetical protein ACFQZK_00465 [Rhodococcus aetherivorans]
MGDRAGGPSGDSWRRATRRFAPLGVLVDGALYLFFRRALHVFFSRALHVFFCRAVHVLVDRALNQVVRGWLWSAG